MLRRPPPAVALAAFLAALVASAPAADPPRPTAPVKVIFDTDMDSDCDDVGALGMLHALADRGEAAILATGVSSKNEWSPACVDAINTFYGRPDLPIGRPKGAGAQKASKYAKGIAARFPHDVGPPDRLPDAAELYRKLLLAQPDGSVTLVTVGYLTNVANLLKLPAADGVPSGADVARAKVKEWACMGGNFVGTPAKDDVKLSNNNFTYDKASAHYAVHNWPSRLVFVGREVGSVPSGLKVGARLKALPDANPVRLGYALYFGGEPKDRHVADQSTLLYAVRGRGAFWDDGPPGFMDLQPDMTFEWKPGKPERRQSYLLKRRVDGKPLDRDVERAIEELMLAPPRNVGR